MNSVSHLDFIALNVSLNFQKALSVENIWMSLSDFKITSPWLYHTQARYQILNICQQNPSLDSRFALTKLLSVADIGDWALYKV